MAYQLVFTELEGRRVQIEVKEAGDSQTVSDDGDVSGSAVVEQLRDALVKNLE